MNSRKYKIIFFIVIIILVFLNLYKNIPVSLKKNEGPKIFTESKKENISTNIIIGEKKLSLTLNTNSSLYDALSLAKQNNQLDFSGKRYPALGFFVDSIDNLKNKDGKYLFYYVNGKEASVGVSSYLLKDGDIIEWKLK